MSEKTTFEIRTNHFACFVKLDPDPQLKLRTKWSYTVYQFSLLCIFILRLCKALTFMWLLVLSRVSINSQQHRLNMEVDLQSLFGLHVT